MISAPSQDTSRLSSRRIPPAVTLAIVVGLSVTVHAAILLITWQRDAGSRGDAVAVSSTMPITWQTGASVPPSPAASTAAPHVRTELHSAMRSVAPEHNPRGRTPQPARPLLSSGPTARITIPQSHNNSSLLAPPAASPSDVQSDNERNASGDRLAQYTHIVADARTIAARPALILDAVRREFDRHKFYPTVARRRGWEGDVVLGFRVTHAGTIQNVSIRHSSGFPLLDESAATNLRRVTLNDDIATDLHENRDEFELSVAYRLVDPG